MARSRSSSQSSDSSSNSSRSDQPSGGQRWSWTRSFHNNNSEAGHNTGRTAGILVFARVLLSSSRMPSQNGSTESSPLLIDQNHVDDKAYTRTRGVVWGVLTLLFVGCLVPLLLFQNLLLDSFYPWLGLLPRDPMLAALAILDRAPIIVSTAHRPLRVTSENEPILRRCRTDISVSSTVLCNEMRSRDASTIQTFLLLRATLTRIMLLPLIWLLACRPMSISRG